MIYVEMSGRAGNQFFRYAFARYLQERQYDEITISYNSEQYTGRNGFVNELDNFNVVPYHKYNKAGKVMKNESCTRQRLLCAEYLLFLKIIHNKSRSERAKLSYRFQDILSYNGIYWMREGYYPYKYFAHECKTILVSGAFESYKYFENPELKKKLQEELTPRRDVMTSNLPLLEEIMMSNSVCVNIRRGDFLSNQYKNSFVVCNENYFMSACELMRHKMHDAKFFVFSDDISWCRENICIDEATFVSDKMPPYETLRLMYNCKHFIISNSTFSWWGQYLSRNEDKIVISPDRWNNDGFESPLIDKKWLLINVPVVE